MLKKLSNKEYNQHTSNLYRLGYTKVNQFINSKYRNILLKKVNEEHKIKIKASDYIGAPKRSSRDLLVFNLVGKDKVFVDLIANQNLEKIIRPMLNDPFYNKIPDKHPNYIVSGCTARSSGKKLIYILIQEYPLKALNH